MKNTLVLEFQAVVRESAPYRHRFGLFGGIRLWFFARNSYKLPRMSLFELRVPGLKSRIWLRSGTSDIGTFKQVICQHETEFTLGNQPTLIVDAGANIGLFSVMMARRFPDCRIVALEVEEQNYRLLCRNVASYKNIFPMQRALWRQSGYVKIVDPTVHENAFTVVETDAEDSDGIPSISVGDLLKETGCARLSLLKLDVEGSEREIFEENPKEWLISTDAMLVELHERSTPGCVAAFNEILRMRPHTLRRVGEYHFAVFR